MPTIHGRGGDPVLGPHALDFFPNVFSSVQFLGQASPPHFIFSFSQGSYCVVKFSAGVFHDLVHITILRPITVNPNVVPKDGSVPLRSSFSVPSRDRRASFLPCWDCVFASLETCVHHIATEVFYMRTVFRVAAQSITTVNVRCITFKGAEKNIDVFSVTTTVVRGCASPVTGWHMLPIDGESRTLVDGRGV